MSNVISKAKAFVGAAIGALTLGVSAVPVQAGDLAVSFGFGSHGARPVYDHGYRPAYNRFHDHDFHARPHRRPVVVQRFVEDDDEEECRIIVKRRYNHFGELVVIRKRICH